MDRYTKDWLLLTTDLQVVADIPEGSNRYIQDIVICNPDLVTGVKVEIFIEHEDEIDFLLPTFDVDLVADYKTQGTIKAGIHLPGDYVIYAKLTGAATNVNIRTLF